ncbi:MAG: (d)CMP kinase [Bacteroidetes bacterium]|jgi:cytidylate kinase|nr:(d)CMP kinase [Bacteroidota bacterium]MDA1176636.1 (d)CMP kinase [Bacteroidota bacterium]MDA8531973.1 (d)CMP kinase [Flavobacteriaceae bacterium]
MKKITIAIDGHSSTGKSTLAKHLAKTLDYIYVDSGAMYRAVTLFAIENHFIDENNFDKDALISNIESVTIEIKNEGTFPTVLFLNNKEVSSKIRGMEVSNLVSKVAALPEVRKCLVREQRRMGEQKGIVMDGRDIGTVVFPKAELKIFMTASAQIRAQRRYDELIAKGETVVFDEVYENITSRDQKDSTRADSPLTQANDARVLDNTNLTQSQQYTIVMDWIKALID